MDIPSDRRYKDTHEWHKLDAGSGLVSIGISRVAVDQLTDITFVEVKTKTGVIAAGAVFGEIESVKATSDLYVGVAGEVVEVNAAVIDNPALINEDPYDKGWIIKLKPTDAGQLNQLMSAEAYQKTVGH